MNILVTGACGYKGTVLVPKLLAAGHDVVAFDIMWFGNFLEPHPRLKVVEGDIRDIESIDLRGVRLDGTWQASSFDLAQGLDVKVMHSKLSPETLDRLFRG